jgi:3-oxoadipate enol-lactonase
VKIDVDGCRLAYGTSGAADAPILLLSHALGATADLWRPQLAPFSSAFRVIRYDTRGHGRSGAPGGEYTIERLGRDALAVLDAAGADRAHVCGLSLGGLTAMWLAVHAPQRIGRLVLASTAARIGTPDGWIERVRQVQAGGMEAIADAAMPRWFTEDFRRREPETVARYRAMVASCSPVGYSGGCAALRDTDLRDAIRHIDAPTLVVSGTADPVTPPADGTGLRERIPGARMVTFDAAHLPNVEQADRFSDVVREFLTGDPQRSSRRS